MPGTPSTQSAGAQRAPLMRRESSQTSHTSKHGVASPGSGEHPLRHAVKPAARHKAVVLPRNHSSARNLPKLNRQAQQVHYAAEDGGRRKKSHDGDTEIRLPGSLDESRPVPMRRNMTAYQLPRNTSHSKLKKNLSHGQLTRLVSGSSKNLAALNVKGPPSPGLKGKKKRPKSEDFSNIEKDLHEQEIELARQQHERRESGGKKVGFAVGSEGGGDEDEVPEMEGSGMQEGEWTDQSNSASPFSTRQNTANNSRRASMILDKPPDNRHHSPLSAVTNQGDRARKVDPGLTTSSDSNLKQTATSEQMDGSASDEVDEDGSEVVSEDDDEEEPPSPRSMPQGKKREEEPAETSPQPPPSPQSPPTAPITQRSLLRAAKDQPSPATQRILSRNAHNPAPPFVSNVNTLDVSHSNRPSPAPSMRSSKSNLGEGSLDQEQDELVSRFIPSTSHPSTGSGGNTALNTPKTGSAFHTPENESTLASQHRSRPNSHRASSPGGSTVSGSSGATTPAMARSRTELRMMNDKAMADREDQARLNPIIPPHVFDRRNESLKYGNAEPGPNAQMKPELFQGRFKAVNTELKVVQRFRDPMGEAIARIQMCKGAAGFGKLRGQKTGMPLQQQGSGKLAISRSTTQLAKQRGPSHLSTSTSPPQAADLGKVALTGSKSTTQLHRRGDSRRGKITFSQPEPETPEVPKPAKAGYDGGADEVAKQMWEGLI